MRVPPPRGSTEPMKLTTNSALGRSRCSSQGLSQCHCPVGRCHAPGSGNVTRGRPQSLGGGQAPWPSRSSKTPRTRPVKILACWGSRLAAFRSPGSRRQLERSSRRTPCASASSRHHCRSMVRASSRENACLTTTYPSRSKRRTSAEVRVVSCAAMRFASGLAAPRSRSCAPARPARPIYRGVLPHGSPQGAMNDRQIIPHPHPGGHGGFPPVTSAASTAAVTATDQRD